MGPAKQVLTILLLDCHTVIPPELHKGMQLLLCWAIWHTENVLCKRVVSTIFLFFMEVSITELPLNHHLLPKFFCGLKSIT